MIDPLRDGLNRGGNHEWVQAYGHAGKLRLHVICVMVEAGK